MALSCLIQISLSTLLSVFYHPVHAVLLLDFF